MDAPALVAVLEGILLAPPAADDGDNLLRGKRAAGEQIHL
jgi:hypothetical protein